MVGPINNGAIADVSIQKDKAKYGVVILGLPKARDGAYTSRVVLHGDVDEASKYIPLVSQQMVQMHQQNVNNLEIVSRPMDLGKGNFINCNRNFTEDIAHVFVKPFEKVKEVVTIIEEEGS